MIPRIIHQTWKTEDIPARFRDAAESWRRLHPDWKYCLWTDADISAFMHARFPEYVTLWNSYPDQIQRVDAFRYFVLYDQGGLYSDLDIECLRPFEDLRDRNVVLPVTAPVGLSNDLMMSEPRHPFFLAAITALPVSFERWQRRWILRHLRILQTTGSLHLTRVYRSFPERAAITLLQPDEYSSQDRARARVFHLPGNTWAGWDTRLLSALYGHVSKLSS